MYENDCVAFTTKLKQKVLKVYFCTNKLNYVNNKIKYNNLKGKQMNLKSATYRV